MEEQISMYMHCRMCLNELPQGESPMSYARLNAGITKDGEFQVWCVRHDVNVFCGKLEDLVGHANECGCQRCKS